MSGNVKTILVTMIDIYFRFDAPGDIGSICSLQWT